MPTPFPPNKTAQKIYDEYMREKQEEFGYKPRVGDKVRLVLESIVNEVREDGCFRLKPSKDEQNWFLQPKDAQFITLLSRTKLKLTRKEIEEKVGGEWELIGE